MIVYKLGGAALQHCLSSATVFAELARHAPGPFAIVHGGGPEITATAAKLGIESTFIDGQRVTDAAMLNVVLMALRGKTNSELVLRINHAGLRALGGSGLDANLFECREENPALGLVGKVSHVNSEWVRVAVENGFCPVIASVGLLTSSAGVPQGPCNINADLAATALAQSLAAKEFVFTTDAEGVLDEHGDCIPHLTVAQTSELIRRGVIKGGMIVKIRAALEFLESAPASTLRIAGGKSPEQIARVFSDPSFGTRITAL
ncbi:MAG TPA: acetylglutamate kinase [Bdellovibrionota bacterium]|jgi:acetylglutamate kinase|nr:acetylglutamate kinase [Bdellovibrionota bacterium]